MGKDDGGGVRSNVLGSAISNGQAHKFDDMLRLVDAFFAIQ